MSKESYGSSNAGRVLNQILSGGSGAKSFYEFAQRMYSQDTDAQTRARTRMGLDNPPQVKKSLEALSQKPAFK